MADIDSIKDIKRIDKSGAIDSIYLIPEQINQAFFEVKNITPPKSCINAKNVVVAGMGGSALGGRIIDSLIPQRSRTPIEVFTEFHIPNYVNKNTLVIVSSYSGNTQETIYDLDEARRKNAQIFVITTGGKLAKIAKDNNIDPKFNPSGQPRFALGYSVGAIISILSKCAFIQISSDEMEDLFFSLKKLNKDFSVENSSKNNVAKSLALKLKRKMPVLVSSEHLVGSCHAFKNQLNETSKTFSASFDIPELNHHLMEGLKNPAQVIDHLLFLFFESELYSPHVVKRYSITQEVVEKNNVEIIKYPLKSKTKLEQVFEVVTLGAYVGYYLAILYDIDPMPIPWVDYFKEKIK